MIILSTARLKGPAETHYSAHTEAASFYLLRRDRTGPLVLDISAAIPSTASNRTPANLPCVMDGVHRNGVGEGTG